MAEIIQAAPLRAYDSNGDLVASARLYVYDSGTTTEQTVYQDEGLTTPFSQPIEANGAGVFPPIFVSSGANAKVNVTDPDDAALPGYPIDPVALGSTSSSGASQISFAPVVGNPATNVQTAIETLTALWNAVTAFSRTLLANETAAAWRSALGLGGLATLDVLDEDNFASDSATRPPSQQSVGAYIAARSFDDAHLIASTTSTSGTTMTAGATDHQVPFDEALSLDTSRLPGVSLSGGDVVSVPAGTYYAEWEVLMRHNSDSGGGEFVAALRDETADVDLGISILASPTGFDATLATGRAKFTLSETSTLRLIVEVRSDTLILSGRSSSFSRAARPRFLRLWNVG